MAETKPTTTRGPDAGSAGPPRAGPRRRPGLRHNLAQVLLDDALPALADRPALRSDAGQWSCAELAARSAGTAAAG